MRERGIVRRSLGWLAGITAAVLIVLAVLVGIARLLLPLAPEYQDQIRRFVTEATGFDVAFRSLSASWPLSGPELRFSDVRIAMLSDTRPVFDARELSVGVSIWRLIVDRRLQPGRIAVSGATVKAERLPSGQWLVNTVFLDELLRRPRTQRLPRLDLQLRDIDLLVEDPTRLEPRLALFIRQLDLELGRRLVEFAAEVDGRDGLGSGIELTGRVPVALLPSGRPPDPAAAPDRTAWDVRAAGADLDVARWLRMISNELIPLISGRGDVDVQASFAGTTPTAIDVDLDLGPTVWDGVAAADNNFEGLELQAAWQRGAAGWDATLRRFAVERGSRNSPPVSGAVSYRSPGDDAAGELTAVASDLRLQDLWPVMWSVASTGLRRDLLPERLEGDISDFKVTASLPVDQPPSWVAEATFREVGLVMPAPGWAVTGVTGTMRADQSEGRVDLKSRAGILRFPKLFRTDIRTSGATGLLGWKRSAEGLEVFGDELQIATPDGESRSRVRVNFPAAGPVFVDISARFVASSAPAALNYLPLVRFKPGVVQWLDRAVVAGSVPRAELLWQGPLRGFPYAEGGGRFRAEFTLADAVIDYADNWPRLESATGTVIIDRVTLTSVENRGAIGGIPFADAEIRVPNLIRDAELDVAAADRLQLGQILDFLRQTPVANLLGPTFDTVTGSGPVTTGIDLRVPVARPKDYRLAGTFDLDGARLGLRGVDFGLTALDGLVRLDTDRLAATELTGRFLDEPVKITLRAATPEESGLTQVADVTGETPAGKLAAAFSLPYAEKLAGGVAWEAKVKVPARRAGQPVRIDIRSALEQLVSTLPPPLTKAAGDAEPMRLEVQLPQRGLVQVSGSLERGVSWALQFVSGTRRNRSAWRLERGALRSGRPLASMPAEPGLEIGGTFDTLRFEDWFPGRGAGGGRQTGAGELIRKIDVQAGRFGILGRAFPEARIDARRAGSEWRVAVRGPAAEGALTIPAGPADEAPIVLDMERLWLVEADPAAGDGAADPRNLPAVRASVGDFVLTDLRLGRLTAELAQRGDGIVVEPLVMESPTFRVRGDATWVVEDNDVGRQRSELRLQLNSTNIAPTLEALGYDPVVEGEKASVTLDLFWPGGPSDDFLKAAGGRVVVNLDKGQFLPVEPGGGRFVGLLSIAALPRRLGLDFSDVTDKGLAFDQVKGEFRLDKGNAFTCNLGLEGPVTDVGILGRVSIRDRSYDQLAVVRPHVSDVLAVGGFVGGPVVGSTVLLISQIFRKPLSSLGESYYRVSGPWDQPVVTRVQKSDVDLTPFRDCERYLAEVLKELPPEAELTR
ncbi:MAG: YhdP family protein [Gammaproteobacteria bacterium]|nr:YhdP family protein [Gammaproteobacteria bacterium]